MSYYKGNTPIRCRLFGEYRNAQDVIHKSPVSGAPLRVSLNAPATLGLRYEGLSKKAPEGVGCLISCRGRTRLPAQLRLGDEQGLVSWGLHGRSPVRRDSGRGRPVESWSRQAVRTRGHRISPPKSPDGCFLLEMCADEGEGMGGFSKRQTFDERGLSDPRLDTIGTVGL